VLSPHLKEARTLGMQEGLIASGAAVVALEQSGRVGFVTPAAEQMFDDDFCVSGGLLVTTDSEGATSLARLMRTARFVNARTDLSNIAIRRSSGRRPVIVQPIPLRTAELQAISGVRILLMLVDLDRPNIASVSDLQRLFLLSRAEAEIACLIAQGHSTAEIAAERKVTTATVRGQLKGLFRKLDVTRQSDIVRLVERVGRCAAQRGK
jgi:DNA-binding CsgD family transcriptional regulator